MLTAGIYLVDTGGVLKIFEDTTGWWFSDLNTALNSKLTTGWLQCLHLNKPLPGITRYRAYKNYPKQLLE